MILMLANTVFDPGLEPVSKGGQVMSEGTPRQLLTDKRSGTSEYSRIRNSWDR